MQSEFKLPRKGYCVPRQGTIQVTLLNPLGTVVRMFVVPYDYSDMPPTNVSFIRQRILARMLETSATDSCPNTNEFERLSRNEQMRLLRYAIHLRYLALYHLTFHFLIFLIYQTDSKHLVRVGYICTLMSRF